MECKALETVVRRRFVQLIDSMTNKFQPNSYLYCEPATMVEQGCVVSMLNLAGVWDKGRLSMYL